MEVFIEKTGKHQKLVFSGKASELLAKLGINPETVLIVKNNKVITDDEIVSEADNVRLLSIISGG